MGKNLTKNLIREGGGGGGEGDRRNVSRPERDTSQVLGGVTIRMPCGAMQLCPFCDGLTQPTNSSNDPQPSEAVDPLSNLNCHPKPSP